MRQVAIVYKGDERSTDLAGRAADVLRERGLDFWVECSRLEHPGDPPKDFKPDLVISLGGDGTLLYAARAWGLTGIPLFGINLGRLGFLAETAPEHFTSLLRDILNGRYRVERRMALKVSVERNGRAVNETLALNDVVVNKGALSRIITINVDIHEFGHWSIRADGVIISTPTGSTAYNLSAGGPVVYPTIPALIVTPICPFTLTSRPIVLPASFPVEMWVEATQDQEVHLTVDGQVSIPLEPADRTTVQAHKVGINLIVNPQRKFIDVLRQKLHWA